MDITEFRIHNPISNGWYADPEARFYDGKYYIYVTHSQSYENQLNHSVFVSEDLTHWVKHENIIDMSGFPWVKKAVWAPTIIEKNGKYYYIFASNDIHSRSEKGGLEIAVSDNPIGPFKAFSDKPLINEFINGAQPIDAHLFKDDDGTVYLYYGGWGHCNVCIMNDDMNGFVPFDDGIIFKEMILPEYTEAPCMLKKDGKYVFMWSCGGWRNGTYRVVSAVSKLPVGPFENCRTILSTGDSLIANGPGHNGYIYIEKLDMFLNVYHRHKSDDIKHGINDGNARYICMEHMKFDETGNICPICMTEEWQYKDGEIRIIE